MGKIFKEKVNKLSEEGKIQERHFRKMRQQ
jgi:hypothetical protein